MVPGPYPLVSLLLLRRLPPLTTKSRDNTSRTMPQPAAAVCHSELGELGELGAGEYVPVSYTSLRVLGEVDIRDNVVRVDKIRQPYHGEAAAP